MDLCAGGLSAPIRCAVKPGERIRGDGRDPFTVHRTRGDFALALLGAGGRRFGSPRRHRCRISDNRQRVGIRSATRPALRGGRRHGPRLSVYPGQRLQAGTLHARVPSRQLRIRRRPGCRAWSGGAAHRIAAIERPRLHREEADFKIIDRLRGEIKCDLLTMDGSRATCPAQPLVSPASPNIAMNSGWPWSATRSGSRRGQSRM